MKKVISFAASPQNLLKLISIEKAFKKYRKEVKHLICHAGKEEDEKTSLAYFEDIDFPKTSYYIPLGAGSHAAQTAGMMLEAEKILLAEKPDLIILSGYNDATLAFGITASKMRIPIAHIDSGLRSYEKYNSQEINRLLTDVLCEYHFVSEHSAMKNLRDEGHNSDNIHFTGNTLIDALEMYWSDMEESHIVEKLLPAEEKYIVVSLKRADNFDNDKNIQDVTELLGRLGQKCKVVWLLPKTLKENLDKKGWLKDLPDSVLIPGVVSYVDFLALVQAADAVITDSENAQQETTYLSAQCITIKKYTERIVTLDVGTNQLVGFDFEKAEKAVDDILKGTAKPGRIPEMWDGKTGKRIVDILMEEME